MRGVVSTIHTLTTTSSSSTTLSSSSSSTSKKHNRKKAETNANPLRMSTFWTRLSHEHEKQEKRVIFPHIQNTLEKRLFEGYPIGILTVSVSAVDRLDLEKEVPGLGRFVVVVVCTCVTLFDWRSMEWFIVVTICGKFVFREEFLLKLGFQDGVADRFLE